MALLARVAARNVTRLSPSYVRVELAGPDLADFGVDGPTYDQRIKLLFPGPAGLPVLRPECWWDDYRALPEGDRGHLRTYTIRGTRGSGPDTGIVVDFVLHPGAHGPGSSWAGAAVVGDEILAVVPRRGEAYGGIEWCPGAADRLLLVADETAVPAACSILGSLPADARGTAYLEVPAADDVQDVVAPAGVAVRWLPRDGAPVGSLATSLLGANGEPDAIDPDLWETPTYSSSGEPLGSGNDGADDLYAWVAGESGLVTAVRRHLVTGLGLPRRQLAFMGYWRLGVGMRS